VREAAIVAAARTPVGKAYRGAFNDTHGVTMGGHALAEAFRARDWSQEKSRMWCSDARCPLV
jgi:acetyl-CoA acetyltransferase